VGAEESGRLDRAGPLVSALSKARVEILEDEEEVARRAAEVFKEIEPKKVVLAGGETPRRAFELIAQLPMAWREIDLFQSDERWVAAEDERSNARMITETLGSRLGEARFHRIATSGSPQLAAEDYATQVKEALPFDLTFLGMGSDGHTASLFPEHPNYDRTDVLAFAFESQQLAMWRVSLSLRALNDSRHVVFLVTGEEKARALAETLNGAEVPAGKVNPIGTLNVLADKAAAQLL
jgi:6-phosphogluconolactonase